MHALSCHPPNEHPPLDIAKRLSHRYRTAQYRYHSSLYIHKYSVHHFRSNGDLRRVADVEGTIHNLRRSGDGGKPSWSSLTWAVGDWPPESRGVQPLLRLGRRERGCSVNFILPQLRVGQGERTSLAPRPRRPTFLLEKSRGGRCKTREGNQKLERGFGDREPTPPRLWRERDKIIVGGVEWLSALSRLGPTAAGTMRWARKNCERRVEGRSRGQRTGLLPGCRDPHSTAGKWNCLLRYTVRPRHDDDYVSLCT